MTQNCTQKECSNVLSYLTETSHHCLETCQTRHQLQNSGVNSTCTKPHYAAFQRQRSVLSVRIQAMPCSQPTTRSNNTQTQLRLPPRRRPAAQSRAHCRLLGLSRDKLLPARLESSAELPSVQSAEISSTVLSKLNRYAGQRSVSRLAINDYQHKLCNKTTISDIFTVRLHISAGLSSRCLLAGLRILSPSWLSGR